MDLTLGTQPGICMEGTIEARRTRVAQSDERQSGRVPRGVDARIARLFPMSFVKD